MADPVPAGPVNHVLPVVFNEAALSLTCVRAAVSVKAGDSVIWTFFGIPAGYAPAVQFRPGEAGGSPFGPLESLCQTEAAVWGTCRSDQAPATFAYRAVLQKGHLRSDSDGSSLWSSTAGLIIVPSGTGEQKTFTVSPGSPGKLNVVPQLHEMKGADTVTWIFENLPPGSWLPRVTFFRHVGEGEPPNTQLGPFTSLITEAAQVRGTGNTDVKGAYFHEVALLSATTGEVSWVSSDPVIDNRGTVIGPDGPEPEPV